MRYVRVKNFRKHPWRVLDNLTVFSANVTLLDRDGDEWAVLITPEQWADYQNYCS